MKTKPFLKWAGGKYRLLDTILNELPSGTRLVEPFAGSAAVYLNAPFAKALVCDINQDLIALYTSLQREGEDFIHYCQSFFTAENNFKERYCELREQFNQAEDPRLRGALFLYLNRHAFNGLIRYNSKGRFNVPFGSYKKPSFPLCALRAFYCISHSTKTEFAVKDFRQVFAELQPGDVVYCDPPYVPLSTTASFTAYAQSGFRQADQEALARLASQAWQRGIPVILSNHDTAAARSLYPAADFKRFLVQRLISCRGNNRTPAPEMLAMYR